MDHSVHSNPSIQLNIVQFIHWDDWWFFDPDSLESFIWEESFYLFFNTWIQSLCFNDIHSSMNLQFHPFMNRTDLIFSSSMKALHQNMLKSWSTRVLECGWWVDSSFQISESNPYSSWLWSPIVEIERWWVLRRWLYSTLRSCEVSLWIEWYWIVDRVLLMTEACFHFEIDC